MDWFERLGDGGFPFFKVLIIIALVSYFIRISEFDNTVLQNVDMEPFSEPIQEEVIDQKPFMQQVSGGMATITPIAKYQIYGRVYDRHYRPPKLYVAAIFPYDVSIGFGDFQYEEVYKATKIRMAATVAYTWYSWKDYKEITSKYFQEKPLDHYFTNNHLCPANDNVRKGLSRLRKKDIVYLEGYLIKFKLVRDDGKVETGISSTARDDEENNYRGNNGSGSCEQIYVTRVVSKYGDYR